MADPTRDEDDDLADADYDTWGPRWWQAVERAIERHTALLALAAAALGCIPYFWRTF